MIIELHTAPNEREIDTLYAFLSVDADGKRGIVASVLPNVGSMSLITGSPTAAEYFKAVAETVSRQTGVRIVLYEFKRGEALWATDQ